MIGRSTSCWSEFSRSNRGLLLMSMKLWITCGSVKMQVN
ncbi:hypothetical protein LINPERHAP1_LOCUS30041 [Linum perenne]